MSMATANITSITKGEKMEEIKIKTEKFFEYAKNMLSKEDLVKTVKTVGAGIKHLLELAYYAGVSIVGLIVNYIKQFIGWVRKQYNDAAAKFAEKHLSNIK